MRSIFLLLLAPALHGADQSTKLTEFAKGYYAEREASESAAKAEAIAAAEGADQMQIEEAGFAAALPDRTKSRLLYESTLAADPDSFYLAQKTSSTQLTLRDLPAASGTLRAYTKAHPDHLDSHLYYADFLNQWADQDAGARKAAIDTLEAANQRFPHTNEVFSRLINHYENSEETDKSHALFDAQFDAPEAGPFHWMSLAPIARTLLPGDSPELTKRLDLIAEKTAETGIELPAAVQSVSDYYRSTNRLDQAITVLQQHVAAVPDSLTLRTRLGLLLLYADRDAEAEQSLLETLVIDPEQVLAHKALAKFYADQGDAEKSLYHRAEVLKIAGGDPSEFLELANQYLDNAQPHQARLLLEKARFDHPEDPGLAARLAIATLRDGDTTAAALLFRQAESLAKDSADPAAKEFLGADFQLEFAGSLREAGDDQAAEARLQAAAKSTPADQPEQQARAFRELARLWLDQNKNHAPAASLLKRAKALDPDNEETDALLERARK